MKPEVNLPRVYSGKISLGKTMFPWAKVRSVTTANVFSLLQRGETLSFVFNVLCRICIKRWKKWPTRWQRVYHPFLNIC